VLALPLVAGSAIANRLDSGSFSVKKGYSGTDRYRTSGRIRAIGLYLMEGPALAVRLPISGPVARVRTLKCR
jgi:hypothetical protein